MPGDLARTEHLDRLGEAAALHRIDAAAAVDDVCEEALRARPHFVVGDPPDQLSGAAIGGGVSVDVAVRVQALEHARKAPQIDLLIVVLLAQQLGRTVQRRARRFHRLVQVHLARAPKVGNLRSEALVDEHILRLEVTMDDGRPLAVQVRHRTRDAARHRQLVPRPREGGACRLVLEDARERPVRAQLEHDAHVDVLEAPAAAQDLHEVGVAQRELQLELGSEHLQVGLVELVAVQLLDGDRRAVEARTPHLAKRAAAQLRLGELDLVNLDHRALHDVRNLLLRQHTSQRLSFSGGGAVAFAQLLELPRHRSLATHLLRLDGGGRGDLNHHHHTAEHERAQRRCEQQRRVGAVVNGKVLGKLACERVLDRLGQRLHLEDEREEEEHHEGKAYSERDHVVLGPLVRLGDEQRDEEDEHDDEGEHQLIERAGHRNRHCTDEEQLLENLDQLPEEEGCIVFLGQE